MKKNLLSVILLAGLVFASCTKDKNDDDKNLLLAAYAMASANTSSSSSLTYKIVDTGQNTCYNSSTGAEVTCTKTGYDGDYAGNQPSYTKSSDGKIITDNVTGLMWTQSSDINGDGTVNDSDKRYPEHTDSSLSAKSYCDNLSLGGYDDWRLPDVKTLYSLILFTGKDASTADGCTGGSGTCNTASLTLFLDTNYFDKAFGDTSVGDRVIDGQYATTSKYVTTTMGGDTTIFGLNFVDGRIKGYGYYKESSKSYFKKFYVRCVRGNTSYGVNNFVDNGDQTISDKATGLMWQKDDADSTDFDNAVSVCEKATTANYSDWRLPNVKELQSIVDYSRSPDTTSSAAIDAKFNATSITNENGKTDYAYYWASSTHLEEVGATVTASTAGTKGTYVSFGRANGYFTNQYLDVHGAGAQKSNSKQSISTSHTSIDLGYGKFYYNGPQGDVERINNKVRCVRNY